MMGENYWDHSNPFVLTLLPQSEDIDGLNHTNNAVYVRWCETIGWAHSVALGIGLADYQALNRAMAIRRGEYDYLAPSFLGDQLQLGTWLSGSDGKITLERRFQLIRSDSGETVLRGRWDLVCIEISSGRPKRMPKEFLQTYLPALINPIVP